MNEEEVKEHFTFIHNYYQNDNQRIFFNDNNMYMLEKLTLPRVLLYKKV